MACLLCIQQENNMTCKCHRAWGKLGKEKRRTIFWNVLTAVCVVIIGIIALTILVEVELRPRLETNKVLYPDQSEDRIPGDRPHARFMGLPPAPHCDHLHDHPGKHTLWASCMGVAYNDSKIDRFLYKDRKGEPPEAAGGDKKNNQYPSDPRWDDPTED